MHLIFDANMTDVFIVWFVGVLLERDLETRGAAVKSDMYWE